MYISLIVEGMVVWAHPLPGTCHCGLTWGKGLCTCEQNKDLRVRPSGLVRWASGPVINVSVQHTQR